MNLILQTCLPPNLLCQTRDFIYLSWNSCSRLSLSRFWRIVKHAYYLINNRSGIFTLQSTVASELFHCGLWQCAHNCVLNEFGHACGWVRALLVFRSSFSFYMMGFVLILLKRQGNTGWGVFFSSCGLRFIKT